MVTSKWIASNARSQSDGIVLNATIRAQTQLPDINA